MTTSEEFIASKIIGQKFEAFLFELCAHIRTAGGVGNPEIFEHMPLKEVYQQLYPNGIVIGFRNFRMKDKHQLSYQMRESEVFYEDQ